MLIKLDDVITKVYDRVRLDAATSGIAWAKGRRSALQLNESPAGVVYFDEGRDIEATIPSGREATLDIIVYVTTRHAQVGQAEVAINGWLDAILKVLTDKRELQASPAAVMADINFRTGSNPESSPPDAWAEFIVHTTVYLH